MTRDAGFDPDRLERLAAAITDDVAAERYDGCELVVARHGVVAFHRQFGFADRASRRAASAPAQPFVTMSIGKQLTVAAVFQRIERGDFALDDAGRGPDPRVRPARQVGDHDRAPPHAHERPADDAAAHAARSSPATSRPSCRRRARRCRSSAPARASRTACWSPTRCSPSACGAPTAAGAPYRTILAEDLFAPLGMRDTTLGCPERHDGARRAGRGARSAGRALRSGRSSRAWAASSARTPRSRPAATSRPRPTSTASPRCSGAAASSTASASCRPATIDARAGEPDGRGAEHHLGLRRGHARLAAVSRQPRPRLLPPGRGPFPTPFGLLASPRTFGGFGAGSTRVLDRPRHDVTYVFLSSGLMEDSYSIERHMRLSDLVHAALV